VGLGLEKPNSGLEPGETFFPNSGSDLDSDETFQISRNLGLDIDEIVCLLDSQLCRYHILVLYISITLPDSVAEPKP
jgi:hypothetical protein